MVLRFDASFDVCKVSVPFTWAAFMQFSVGFAKVVYLHLRTLRRVGGSASDEDVCSDGLCFLGWVSLRYSGLAPGAVSSFSVKRCVEVCHPVVGDLPGCFCAGECMVCVRG